MNSFDMQMMALVGLVAFIGLMFGMFSIRYGYAMIAYVVLMSFFWGEDICSRDRQLSDYTVQFINHGEIICHEDGNPILISKDRGWELRGTYLFNKDHGIDLTDSMCEIPNHSMYHCIPIPVQIAMGITFILSAIVLLIREFRILNTENEANKTEKEEKQRLKEEEQRVQQEVKRYEETAEKAVEMYANDQDLNAWGEIALGRELKKRKEERLEQIRQGAAVMAEHYKTDPELKELNEFVGDYREFPDAPTKGERHDT